MISISNTEDIIAIGIKNILSYSLEDAKYQSILSNFNKVIVIEFENIYSVTINFKGEEINIEYGESEEFDLKIILSTLNTMVEMARGDYGPIIGFLKGEIKVKKIWNIGVLLKFIQIFIPNLKIAGERAKKYAY